MSSLPKKILLHICESKDHLEEANETILRILNSKNHDQICKYGENNLVYCRVILNNALNGIRKIIEG